MNGSMARDFVPRAQADQFSREAALHGSKRWAYPIPRHERQSTGISARQQKRRRSAHLRAQRDLTRKIIRHTGSTNVTFILDDCHGYSTGGEQLHTGSTNVTLLLDGTYITGGEQLC